MERRVLPQILPSAWMGLSSRAVATSAVAARGAQLLVGLMVPGDRSLVGGLCGAPRRRVTCTNLRSVRTKRCLSSLALSQATVTYMRGKFTKENKCSRGAAAQRGLLDAPVRFRLTCFKQRASRLYSWPSFGESPRRECRRMLPAR